MWNGENKTTKRHNCCDVANYSTYSSNTCFCVKLHLQEDEKCKPSHQMQDKEASAVGTMIKLRQENEKYVFTKALTRMWSFCDVYSSIRPGCSKLKKETNEIDRLHSTADCTFQYLQKRENNKTNKNPIVLSLVKHFFNQLF